MALAYALLSAPAPFGHCKKIMVGYEMLANPQRYITAEAAAITLRNLSDELYKNRN